MNKTLGLFILTVFITSCFTQMKKNPNETLIKNTILDTNKEKDPSPPVSSIFLKGNGEIRTAGEYKKFSFNIKNKKDSIIWVSIRSFLGLEIARFKITQDSICFLNRLEKKYFAKLITEVDFFSQEHLSFDLLQQIITASPPVFAENHKRKTEKGKTCFFSENLIYCFDQNNKFESAEHKKNKTVLDYKFSEYDKKKLFPNTVYLELKDVAFNTSVFKLTLNYTAVGFNSVRFQEFIIPKNYEQIK